MIDYQEIVENLDTDKIIQLMETLGVTEYIEKPGYVIFPTICHNEDVEEASMKLYYYENSHIFYCYTNCESQSIFKFLKHYYETRLIDYDWYEDIYKVILDCSNYKRTDDFLVQKYKSQRNKYSTQTIPKLETFPKGVLDCFVPYCAPEWLEDGINEQAMKTFDIRYSWPQNKIIIPHFNVNGELVGIRGRALTDWEIENVGKYMPIKLEDKWYSHPLSLNLYGLNVTKEAIKANRICYLFESEKSVMQLESFQMDNCAAAVCGSQFNKWQLKILMKECQPKEIIICFDNEELKGSDKYFDKLYAIGEKYKNYANFSFVYDKEHLLNHKDSPTDQGEEVFKRLIQRRVKVR